MREFVGTVTVAVISAFVPLTLADAAIATTVAGVSNLARIGRVSAAVIRNPRRAGNAILDRARQVSQSTVARVRNIRINRLRANIRGFDNGTRHERRIAEEINLRSSGGSKVAEIRGDNVGGPDYRMTDGKYWDAKEVFGTSRNRLQNTINRLKDQFGNEYSRALGLNRSDARGFIDVRSSPLNPGTGRTWKNNWGQSKIKHAIL